MLHRADCADFGCHNSIRLETKHFLNTLALTFISFSGRFVFAVQKHYLFFFASDPLVILGCLLADILSMKSHIYLRNSLTFLLSYSLCPPHWGVDILFLLYPIFTKFGMGVYWVNSLYGVAFGEDSCIAN